MARLVPRSERLLSPGQIEEMHQAALHVIGTVGLHVPHEKVREILKIREGARVEGEWVRFEPWAVERALGEQSYPEEVRNLRFGIVSGAYELNVHDLETGRVRAATKKDLADFTKLAHSYGMYGSAPVRPSDVAHPELQEILEYKVPWENCPRRCNDIFDANEKSTARVARYVYEMSQAAGKFFRLGIWIASPFKVSYEALDIIYQFMDKKPPLFVATMPIMGATAPIFIPGGYVQSMAELFAGVTMLKLLCPGSPVQSLIIDSIRAYHFDMQHASFVYGSPEDLLATAMQISLNGRYGIPTVAKSLLTTAKEPDAHAAAEKMANTLAAGLQGARIFTNAGLLAIDEIFSGEQLVIDYEIVQYVRRVLEGFEFDTPSLGQDVIRDAAYSGRYIEHDSTLENFRGAWVPTLFEHSSLGVWQRNGSKSLRDRAREVAVERIRSHSYRLPDDVQKELDLIYGRAEREILG